MAIKQRILRIWDDAAAAVKLCCIKFAQRVVLAQTTSVNMDKVRGSRLCRDGSQLIFFPL